MSIQDKYRHALNEFASLRDTARIQVHLFSMDARERWREIEDALRAVEKRALQEGTPITNTVVSTLEQATSRAREFLRGYVNRIPELDVPVKPIMTEGPATCRPDDPASTAVRIMWERDCGAVPIVDESGVVVGMVTDRDLAMAGYLREGPLSAIRLDAVMSRRLFTLRPSSTLGDALLGMSAHRIRRIPITDHDGHLKGIVALGDIARYVHSLEGAEAAHQLLSATLSSISARPGTHPTKELRERHDSVGTGF